MNPHDKQTRLADAIPCPFCASKELDLDARASLEFVCCTNCGTEGPIADINMCQNAITLWNKRAIVFMQSKSVGPEQVGS
jgi:transcription elongation factor Elf1